MNYPAGMRRARPALAGVSGIVLQIYIGCTLVGCSQDAAKVSAPAAEPAEVLVEPAQLALQSGGEAWLAAQANDAAGQPIGGASFSFTPVDPQVLRVSARGRVSSLGPASARTGVRVASGHRERLVPVVVHPGPPQRMEKRGGDGQQVLAGESPAEPLVVGLLDAWGNPLANELVDVAAVGEEFPAVQAVTDATGTARFGPPRLTGAGMTTVVFRAATAEAVIETFALQVVPGPPADVRLVPAEAAGDAPAAAQPRLTLLVVDAFGNPVADVGLSARLGKDDASAQTLRTDTAGRALYMLPAANADRKMNLEVELATTPAVRRSLAVDLVAKPAAG
jgi:hypothetical protein